MLIERLFKAKGGSLVPFGPAENPTIVYHFKPIVEGGPHVCEVEDEEHINRLLSITEGYCEVGQEKASESELVVDGVDYRGMPNEELIERFRKRFGRDPGGRMSREGVIKKLASKPEPEPAPPAEVVEDAFETAPTGNPHDAQE